MYVVQHFCSGVYFTASVCPETWFKENTDNYCWGESSSEQVQEKEISFGSWNAKI